MYYLHYAKSNSEPRSVKLTSLREVKSFIGDDYPEHKEGWRIANSNGDTIAMRYRPRKGGPMRTIVISHYQKPIAKTSFV